MSGVDPYTGAFFTLRYDECKSRITGWGLQGALDAVLAAQADGKMLATEDYPFFSAVKADVVAQAELKYLYREISAETPDAWTHYAKVKWVELIKKYDAVLEMEADVDVTSPDVASQNIGYGHTVQSDIQDTPYGTLSPTSDYVSQRSLITHGGTDTIGTRTQLDSEILMRFRDRWEPTVQKIVDDLGELFIGIIGGEFVL